MSTLFIFLLIANFTHSNTGIYAYQPQTDSTFVYQYTNHTDTIKFTDDFSNIIIKPSDNKRKMVYYPSGLNEIPQDITINENLIIILTDDDRFLNAKWIELRFFGTKRVLKLSYLNYEEKFNMLPEVPILETDIHYPVGLELKSGIIDEILVQEKKEYKNTTIRFDNEMQDFQEFINFYSEYNDIGSVPFRLILREYLKQYPIVDKDARNSYYKLLLHLKEVKDYPTYKYLKKLIRKSEK